MQDKLIVAHLDNYLGVVLRFIFFFFSSRRRHTRFDCDWSSDVCSSDLGARLVAMLALAACLLCLLAPGPVQAQAAAPAHTPGGEVNLRLPSLEQGSFFGDRKSVVWERV